MDAKIKSKVEYAAALGAAAILLASGPQNAISQTTHQKEELNAFLEKSDYPAFNMEVTSKVKPLIEEVMRIMQQNGFCSTYDAGSIEGTGAFFSGKARKETYCNSNRPEKGGLFGDVNAIYDASKIKDSGEENSVLRIFDKNMDFNIEDRNADGLRLLGNDYLRTQSIGLEPAQNLRKSESAELFTKLNSFYKSILERMIGNYKNN